MGKSHDALSTRKIIDEPMMPIEPTLKVVMPALTPTPSARHPPQSRPFCLELHTKKRWLKFLNTLEFEKTGNVQTDTIKTGDYHRLVEPSDRPFLRPSPLTNCNTCTSIFQSFEVAQDNYLTAPSN